MYLYTISIDLKKKENLEVKHICCVSGVKMNLYIILITRTLTQVKLSVFLYENVKANVHF